MNTIREAAMAVVEAGGRVEYAGALEALRVEADRMEAELAAAKEDFKILQGHFSLSVLERNALSDKLAALEAPEPTPPKFTQVDLGDGMMETVGFMYSGRKLEPKP